MGVFIRDERSPDKSTPTAAPYAVHRPLTAAAVRLNVNDKTQIEQLAKRRTSSSWQEDAWEYYDLIGEVKYAFRLFSNVLSRVRLTAGYIDDEDSPPSALRDVDAVDDRTKAAVNRAMRRAFGATSQAEVLRRAAINLLVAGECYLVQLPASYGVREHEQWKILSINELVTKDGAYFYRSSRNAPQTAWERLPNSAFVGRIWSEHARYADEADSSMRALISDCDDLFLYTRAGRGAARSRLNAGAFFVPDTMSVSADQPTDFPDDIPLDPEVFAEFEDPDDDTFEQEMFDHFSAPIADESAASSVVPFLIRGTREDGAALRHIKFDRPFDVEISKRADRALERILQGIDLPKDIVTGLANIKYSNAIQIEESFYTAHIEPVVLLLCDAFRAVYLIPALEAEGVDPSLLDNIVIWYDPSAIMTAPDKSNAANVGFDKYALSYEAWRRANGFSETDAPTGEEVAQRIAIARGQLNDALTEQLFRTLMPEIMDQARAQAIQDSPTGPMSPDLQDALNPNATPPPDSPGSPTGGLPPIVDGGSDEPQPPPAVPGT
jgi:hypothetical protein